VEKKLGTVYKLQPKLGAPWRGKNAELSMRCRGSKWKFGKGETLVHADRRESVEGMKIINKKQRDSASMCLHRRRGIQLITKSNYKR